MHLHRHGAYLLLALAFMRLAEGVGRICPLPECDACLDPKLKSGPGIGFHLGLTSGTVVLSSNSGHIQDIANLPAFAEYISLMRDLTTHPDRLDRPLNTVLEGLEHLQKRLQRQANLLLGRPGTPQAGTLAAMLSGLRQQLKSHSDAPKGTIGVVLPNAACTSLEEVNDALAYAGFERLHGLQIPDNELNAAFAAHGHGLCESYTDPYQCEEEEATFPKEVILHLDYTDATLAANTDSIITARERYAITKFVDWSLGRYQEGDKPDNDYWVRLGQRITELLAASSSRQLFTKILLTGTCAGDEKFRDVLKNVTRCQAMNIEVSSAPTEFAFVPARGAAEMQRRRQQGWAECRQPKRCTEGTMFEKAKVTIRRYLEL